MLSESFDELRSPVLGKLAIASATGIQENHETI